MVTLCHAEVIFYGVPGRIVRSSIRAASDEFLDDIKSPETPHGNHQRRNTFSIYVVDISSSRGQ